MSEYDATKIQNFYDQLQRPMLNISQIMAISKMHNVSANISLEGAEAMKLESIKESMLVVSAIYEQAEKARDCLIIANNYLYNDNFAKEENTND